MTPEMHRNAKHLVTSNEHFEKDCDYFFCQLNENFDWFLTLDVLRQLAIVALAYALGWKNFIALANLIFYLSRNDYYKAAEEVEKKGYHYIADVLRSGELKFAESK